MDQLPFGDGAIQNGTRRPRSPNSRPNIPLPVLILGCIAMIFVLFSLLVVVKMGTPAKTTEVEAELAL